MAVYLGSAGYIELVRYGSDQVQSVLDAADVDVTAKRFSFDFPSGTFATGDRLLIRRANADWSVSTQPLDFVSGAGWGDGTVRNDGAWYINVDSLGGIRLFRTYAAALKGSVTDALALARPSQSYSIAAKVENDIPNCIAQVLSYSINTERNAIDVTALGDAFNQQVSGLINGSGRITCAWDWLPSACAGDPKETAQYFHQLILRQRLGAEFKANLIVKSERVGPENGSLSPLAQNTALYYEVTAIATEVGLEFTPDAVLQSQISFVCTGDIELRYQVPSVVRVLQEDRSLIKLEDVAGYLAQELDL